MTASVTSVVPMRTLLFCAMILWALGCGTDDSNPSSSCVDAISADCTPQYTPVFDKVFELTLTKSCSVGDNACHSSSGAKGGLVLDDVETAYQMLVNPTDAAPRIVAGDPACSSLVQRLETDNSALLMPPGKKLSPEERCAIIQWVAAGATR